MNSVILSADNEIIAIVDKTKSSICYYAYEICKECIDAKREYNLINCRPGKISNNKKYMRGDDYHCANFAKKINDHEYLILFDDEN